MRSVVFPANLEEIRERAFCCCATLEKITFPSNSALMRICAKAFKGTGISVLDIPESLRFIGSEAFANTRIREVSFPQIGPEISETAFSGCGQIL